MKIRSLLLLSGVLALCALLVLPSCNKKFDEPPSNTPTLSEMGVNANITIANLKTLVGGSGSFRQITDDLVVVGVVSANDKSGNLYKELYLQDTSGAISILLNATGLYNNFPVGRQIAIKLKGLWLNNQNGMKKLCSREIVNGTTSSVGIASAVISDYIIKGALDQPIVIPTLTYADLTTNMLGRLVKLENYEVVASELRNTYSDPSPAKVDQNIDIRSCSGDQIIFRTSAYANFAGIRVPQGNGSIIALYTIYNSTKQLIVRDTSDLQFRNIRCDGTIPGTPDTLLTIAQVRAIGEGNTIPAHRQIDGVITSNTLNEASGNYIIQDESGAAIQLRFTTSGNKNYSLGDSVNIDVSGITLSRFSNGALQVNNLGPAYVLGQGTATVTPTTIAEIQANQAAFESRVVRLSNVTITQASVNSTGVNYNITDGTGTIVTFIRNTLGVVPTATAMSITGYVGIFSGAPQLNLRDASDIH